MLGMTSDEYAAAEDIFRKYNRYRKKMGLAPALWSAECAKVAQQGAEHCSATSKIVHHSGFPKNDDEFSKHHGELLLFGTWKMSGDDVICQWEISAAHRKRMQCDSADLAGCAAHFNQTNGTWYFCIVYHFSGNRDNSGS